MRAMVTLRYTDFKGNILREMKLTQEEYMKTPPQWLIHRELGLEYSCSPGEILSAEFHYEDEKQTQVTEQEGTSFAAEPVDSQEKIRYPNEDYLV